MGMHQWSVSTEDYHTAGEPFRIVPEPPCEIPGATVLERRENARTGPADELRRLLVNEPRGHADMYGGFLVPPNDPGAHFGVLFWHKDGFSTACGHGTIALGTWAVRSGLVPAPDDGETEVVIDVPSGRVRATVVTVGGAVESVVFRNVPSYAAARNVAVHTEDFGDLSVDVLWGGALYASLPAPAVGLSVVPADVGRLVEAGRQVKAALRDHPASRHPTDPRLDGIYGTIFWEAADPVPAASMLAGEAAATSRTWPGGGSPGIGGCARLTQRNVTVFADGQVDRSPCGSGTAARVAALTSGGELAEGGILDHFSLIGSVFQARAVGRSPRPGGEDAVVVEVLGDAFPVGRCTFTLDPRDGLGLGFTLR